MLKDPARKCLFPKTSKVPFLVNVKEFGLFYDPVLKFNIG